MALSIKLFLITDFQSNSLMIYHINLHRQKLLDKQVVGTKPCRKNSKMSCHRDLAWSWTNITEIRRRQNPIRYIKDVVCLRSKDCRFSLSINNTPNYSTLAIGLSILKIVCNTYVLTKVQLLEVLSQLSILCRKRNNL